MDLTTAKKTLAKNLSGGMQRRLDIACALIHDPQVLLLDEPTADLDPLLGKHIWNIIKTINKQGTTVIVSSHHTADIENICTRIGFLKKGRLVHVGTIQDIKKKFTSRKKIHIESYPGNYDKLIAKLKHDLITKKENRGHEMVIQTKSPEKMLLLLLDELKKNQEILIDLKLETISLNELFSKI
jgi:ABC-2 type transport system ATP-binding protein